MKSLILTLVLIAFAHCHIINKDYLATLKNKVSKFTIANYENHRFKDMSMEEIRQTLGLRFREKTHVHVPKGRVRNDIPANFDARTQWPECIGVVRDQASCGSCWAFGAAESFGDRVCIAENTKVREELSTQSLVSCDWENYGCNGGYLDKTWTFLAQVGIPTEKCWSYKSSGGSVPACPNNKSHKVTKCEDKSDPVFFRVSDVVHPNTVSDIKAEILANGPMETGFVVYEDFMSYGSGIYRHEWGDELGGHAIKVVGWGEEKGENYWIAINSWGTGWGEEGTFKILEGECDFESEFYAGTPIKTSTYSRLNFLE